ncbi:unnamed protein product [Ceutorhynchus assimilis]|uniref:dolichol kinase n=1 Tax=Ceutorhynchus assimilis TaxID=467358 RepID=A0A9N9MYI4_9CUCU|nr:unnamed protein product [Ceutorhynchus assimilis]
MPQKILEEFYLKNNFSVRPNGSQGLWALFLLPITLIVSSLSHPIILTPTYKLTTVIAFALLCNSVYVVVKCLNNERLKIINVWMLIIAFITGCLFNVWLQKGWGFAIASGLGCSVFFLKCFKFLLGTLTESFTLGEAGLTAQGLTLFIYSTVLNLNNPNLLRSNMQISTVIIQIGLLGIITLAYVLYKFNIRQPKAFYLTAIVTLTITIIVPLHVILGQSPVLWIFGQVLGDVLLLKLFAYWTLCIAVAILAVSNQIYYAKRASTSTRKVFHVLAVLVYVPGLYFRCSFLYLASGVVLGVFFVLEILRLLSIPPLGSRLQDGYIVFSDDKDTGLLALTPIYLLVGISLPIWLHPSPCDVTDSAQFGLLPLLSGLLSIGIGDTSASYIGSNFGKFKWKDSLKTIEGTLGCVLSQLGFVYLLFYLGVLWFLTFEHVIRIVIAVIVGSLVEAKTTQIDNLVLPLVMYIILV